MTKVQVPIYSKKVKTDKFAKNAWQFCLFLFFLFGSVHLSAQKVSDKNISISVKNEPLKKVLKSIEAQSFITLAYKNETVKGIFVTINLSKVAIETAIEQVLLGTNISYQIRKDKILLFKKKEPLTQVKYTLSGFISDSSNGEVLIGANIFDAKKKVGARTDAHGYFSLTLPEASYSFIVSYVGFAKKKVELSLNANRRLNIDMNQNNTLKKIIIKNDNEDIMDAQFTIKPNTINLLPTLAGEHDPIRALQYLPGVKSGTETSTGLFVRGGAPEENLILLDGVTIYNPTHLFGFQSIFNSDIINEVTLSKGGFKAQYGGRLSSVLDVNMKNGNKKRNTISASFNPLVSKLTVEGPLKKDKGSFIVSFRRSLTDIYLNKWEVLETTYGTDSNKSKFNFYDFNAKLNYKLNQNNRVFLSVYAGEDNFKYDQILTGEPYKSSSMNKLKYGNKLASTRWQHIFNNKLISNFSFALSKYETNTNTFSKNNFNISESSEDYNLAATISDKSIKADLNYYLNPNHYVVFGANLTNHTFQPSSNSRIVDNNEIQIERSEENINANELNIYVQDEWKKNKFQLNGGLRTTVYNVNKKTYTSIQPRISVQYKISSKLTGNVSYAQMAQFLHLLTNSNVGLPTDVWILPTQAIKPQLGRQVATKLSYKPNKNWQLSAEAYYKHSKQLIAYREGASYLQNSFTVQEKITTGNGQSKGIELFIQKRKGKTTGWIGYTLSKTTRQFAEINSGKVYPYIYDHRHDFSAVLIHSFSKHFNISTSWVYTSGGTTSIPSNQYALNLNTSNMIGLLKPQNIYFGERNNYRMRDYHRLDVSMNYTKPTKWGEHSFHFNIYNVYNQFNTVFISRNFEIENGNLVSKYKENALFPFMPSIGYKLKLYGKTK